MKRIAKFHKVSFERFFEDSKKCLGAVSYEECREAYDKLKLPSRATKGSAGYDFFVPYKLTLNPKASIKIPSGIRAEIDCGWVLKLYPRSGLGFKYRMQLDNTVGIIDSDYFYSDNEGHIIIKISNDTYDNAVIDLPANAGFAQGIFLEFGITQDDETEALRNGGFGSTSKL
jgi:dUTP pyrophosphatase